MKIFTTESVMNEVSQNMDLNIIKNANTREQAETSHRVQAIERLVEAAELYEQTGNIKKAKLLTQIITKLVESGLQRSNSINYKISVLETTLTKLGEVNNEGLNRHYINSAEFKIKSLLSNLTSVSENIFDTITNLKRTYQPTEKTLFVIAEMLNIAQGTLNVIESLDDNNTKDKKIKEPNGSKILHHYGFTDMNEVNTEGLSDEESWED